jgi:hypothetical protein
MGITQGQADAAQISARKPKASGQGGYPNSDDQECPSSAYRALCASLRLLTELRHERGRDHFDNQENSDGQDDHLIDIAKDGMKSGMRSMGLSA